MRIIGMSWESSQEYSRIINEKNKENMGGLYSAKSLLFSFDFHETEELQTKGKLGTTNNYDD